MQRRWCRLMAVMGLVCAGGAVAEDLQFQLINQTGYNVTGFYVSHTGTNQWEENLMPQGYVLAPGYYVDVNIRDGLLVCEYDIAIVFDSGDQINDYELDLCELGSYTVE